MAGETTRLDEAFKICEWAQYCIKMEWTGPTTTKFPAKRCLFTRLHCDCTENQIESGKGKTMRIHCFQKEPLYQNQLENFQNHDLVGKYR